MTHTFFIASRLRYKRRIVTISIAISYIIMIVAVAVSSGFRSEVRDALSQMGGDIQLCPSNLNFLDEAQPINSNPSYLSQLRELKQVESVQPAVYRAGIMKVGDNIHGVLIKGVQTDDTTALAVSIPLYGYTPNNWTKNFNETFYVSASSGGDVKTSVFYSEYIKNNSYGDKFSTKNGSVTLTPANSHICLHASGDNNSNVAGKNSGLFLKSITVNY